MVVKRALTMLKEFHFVKPFSRGPLLSASRRAAQQVIDFLNYGRDRDVGGAPEVDGAFLMPTRLTWDAGLDDPVAFAVERRPATRVPRQEHRHARRPQRRREVGRAAVIGDEHVR